MALRTNVKNTKFTVQGMDLEWVKDYIYLGIWIGHTRTFILSKRRSITCLTKPRKLSVMKIMTGRHRSGTQRSFYVHTVQPIVDYDSVAIIASSTTLKEKQ